MARARSIKPGYFTNDALAEAPPLGRILFAGLWCIADRAGRLEDRPKRIKAEVLPYDDVDVDALLDDLAVRGFVIRYEIDGSKYLQVTNFDKHQDPHVKEKASTIPAPCQHRASTVQKPLTPDSGLLTPDSIKTGRAERELSDDPPPGVLPHIWIDWQKHRGKKLSKEAIRRQVQRLAELEALGHNPNAVILQSIERGWSGLFEVNAKSRAPPGGALTPAEQRQRNMDILTGKAAQHEQRVIEGVSSRVGSAAVLAIPSDLRQSRDDDVGGGGPARSAAGMG